MNIIREAFDKIKQDISELRQEILELKYQINTLRITTKEIQTPTQADFSQTSPTQNQTTPSRKPDNQTMNQTMDYPLEPRSTPNLAVSTGNGGVPTDKQTDRQTDKQTDKYTEIDKISDFERANEILESLDSIKKGIRLKFKRLTPQEMLVFSTLYSLGEQNIEEISYKLIANNTNLSESSIRDYVNKLIKKGVPILKIRQNNKKIMLKVSSDLQKIASLSTIIKLREL